MSKFKNLMSKIVIVFAMALIFGILGHSNVSAQGVDQYTKLLMHMDNDTFKDEIGHSITNNGVTINNSTYKFGSGSGYFNGSSSYLTTPKINDFEISTGDFTIEAWIKIESQNLYHTIICQNTGAGTVQTHAYDFVVTNSNKLRFMYPYGGSGSNYLILGTTTITTDWTHVAVTRSGNIIRLFVNGHLDATQDVSSNPIMQSQTSPVTIGRFGNYSANYFKGYIDEVRLSKGIARWTTDFTPPNAPYNNDTKLTASANTTDTAITLNWDKVDGATGYNVKRSTTQGSGYATIASNVTENTYNDTTVQAGTTYYYIVTPIINGQEGTPSNEASATANKLTESGNVILTITMTNGNIKSYTVSMTKVNDFISWYNSRSSGSNGSPYYAFDKTDNLQPFTKKTEYIVFDKISSFEVDEYSK
jgi:hypothetical protein